MIALEPHADGVILPIRVRPGGRRNAITGEQAGMLKLSVTQAPEKGKANAAVIELLCDSLGLQKSQVEVIAGQTSPQKRVLVPGIEVMVIERRVREILVSLE